MRANSILSAVVVIATVLSGCASAAGSVDDTGKKTQPSQQPSTTSYGPADFQVSGLVIDPRVPATGDMFSVFVTVSNSGGPGEYKTILTIDEVTKRDFKFIVVSTKVFSKTQMIGAVETATIEFSGLSLLEGTYILSVEQMEEYVEIGC